MLVRLLNADDGIAEQHLLALPRVRIVYEPLDVSGSSHWNGREWIICLNGGDSLLRQRFTMLHEFAHILWHGNTHLLFQGTKTLTPADQAEVAADYFAGCALVPRRLLKRAWGQGLQQPEALAEHFGVSKDAMTVRLAQTGLSRAVDREHSARCARPISTMAGPQRFRPAYRQSGRAS